MSDEVRILFNDLADRADAFYAELAPLCRSLDEEGTRGDTAAVELCAVMRLFTMLLCLHANRFSDSDTDVIEELRTYMRLYKRVERPWDDSEDNDQIMNFVVTKQRQVVDNLRRRLYFKEGI